MARKTALESAREQDEQAREDYYRAKQTAALYYVDPHFSHAHYARLQDRKRSFESIWNRTGELVLALEDQARSGLSRRKIAEISADLQRARELLATDPRLALQDPMCWECGNCSSTVDVTGRCAGCRWLTPIWAPCPNNAVRRHLPGLRCTYCTYEGEPLPEITGPFYGWQPISAQTSCAGGQR